ncbi:MAG: hypothetical protein ACLR6J_09835 [Parabacteroides merdae]
MLVEEGKNEIIILDLLGPEKAVVEGRKEPISWICCGLKPRLPTVKRADAEPER